MRTSDLLNTLDYLVRKQLAWKPHEVIVNRPWLMLRAGKSQYTLYTGPSVDLSVLGLVRVPGFAPPNPRFRDILTRIASPFSDALTPAVSYYVFAHTEPVRPDTLSALRAFAKELPVGFQLEHSGPSERPEDLSDSLDASGPHTTIWRLVLNPVRSTWLKETHTYAIRVPYRLQSFPLRQVVRALHHIFTPEFAYEQTKENGNPEVSK